MSLGEGEARCRDFLRKTVDYLARVNLESGAETVAGGVIDGERHCPHVVGGCEIGRGVGSRVGDDGDFLLVNGVLPALRYFAFRSFS